MASLIVGAIIVVIVLFLKPRRKTVNLASLPQRFVVLDLETTGLDPAQDEIIEIGAIRVNRDSNIHGTFRALVKPIKHIPKKITEITGISQDMVDREGDPLEEALREFATFIEDLPLVTFNAELDMAFLKNAAKQSNLSYWQSGFMCFQDGAARMARPKELQITRPCERRRVVGRRDTSCSWRLQTSANRLHSCCLETWRNEIKMSGGRASQVEGRMAVV